jgi:hypothetical protein
LSKILSSFSVLFQLKTGQKTAQFLRRDRKGKRGEMGNVEADTFIKDVKYDLDSCFEICGFFPPK